MDEAAVSTLGASIGRACVMHAIVLVLIAHVLEPAMCIPANKYLEEYGALGKTRNINAGSHAVNGMSVVGEYVYYVGNAASPGTKFRSPSDFAKHEHCAEVGIVKNVDMVLTEFHCPSRVGSGCQFSGCIQWGLNRTTKDVANAVVATEDRAVYVVGGSYVSSDRWEMTVLQFQPNTQGLLALYGTQSITKQGENAVAYAVAVRWHSAPSSTLQQQVYVAGYISASPIAGYVVGTYGGKEDMVLFAINPDVSKDTVDWVTVVGGSNSDVAFGLTVDYSSDTMYMVGDADCTVKPQTVTWDDDCPNSRIVKIRCSDGEILNQQEYNGLRARAVAVHYDSQMLYVAGYSKHDLHKQRTTSGTNPDFVLVKYDSGLNRLWTGMRGTPQGDFALALTVDSAGRAYVAGWSNGAYSVSKSFDGQFINKGSSYKTGILVAYDPSGNWEWTEAVGAENGDDLITGVGVRPQGLIFAGSTNSDWRLSEETSLAVYLASYRNLPGVSSAQNPPSQIQSALSCLKKTTSVSSDIWDICESALVGFLALEYSIERALCLVQANSPACACLSCTSSTTTTTTKATTTMTTALSNVARTTLINRKNTTTTTTTTQCSRCLKCKVIVSVKQSNGVGASEEFCSHQSAMEFNITNWIAWMCNITNKSWIHNLVLKPIEKRRRLGLLERDVAHGVDPRHLSSPSSDVQIEWEIIIPAGMPESITVNLYAAEFDKKELAEVTSVLVGYVNMGIFGDPLTLDVTFTYNYIPGANSPTPATGSESDNSPLLVIAIVVSFAVVIPFLVGLTVVQFMQKGSHQDDYVGLEREVAFWTGVNLRDLLQPPGAISEQEGVPLAKFARAVSKLSQRDCDCSPNMPKVFIIYSHGHRNSDADGYGPGTYYAAAVLKLLHENGVACFADFGLSNDMGMCDRLNQHSGYAVVLVLQTEALYYDREILKQIYIAQARHIEIMPLRFESYTPSALEQWPDITRTDLDGMLMVAEVQNNFCKLNSIPSPPYTVVNQDGVLSHLLVDVKLKFQGTSAKPAVLATGQYSHEPNPVAMGMVRNECKEALLSTTVATMDHRASKKMVKKESSTAAVTVSRELQKPQKSADLGHAIVALAKNALLHIESGSNNTWDRGAVTMEERQRTVGEFEKIAKKDASLVKQKKHQSSKDHSPRPPRVKTSSVLHNNAKTRPSGDKTPRSPGTPAKKAFKNKPAKTLDKTQLVSASGNVPPSQSRASKSLGETQPTSPNQSPFRAATDFRPKKVVDPVRPALRSASDYQLASNVDWGVTELGAKPEAHVDAELPLSRAASDCKPPRDADKSGLHQKNSISQKRGKRDASLSPRPIKTDHALDSGRTKHGSLDDQNQRSPSRKLASSGISPRARLSAESLGQLHGCNNAAGSITRSEASGKNTRRSRSPVPRAGATSPQHMPSPKSSPRGASREQQRGTRASADKEYL